MIVNAGDIIFATCCSLSLLKQTIHDLGLKYGGSDEDDDGDHENDMVFRYRIIVGSLRVSDTDVTACLCPRL